jgi:hypothetical protein
VTNGEGLQVLRYENTQKYEPHFVSVPGSLADNVYCNLLLKHSRDCAPSVCHCSRPPGFLSDASSCILWLSMPSSV